MKHFKFDALERQQFGGGRRFGRIKFYNHDRAFGYVRDDSGEEFFVHPRECVPGEVLCAGLRVSFSVGDHNGRERAALNVRII